MKNTNILIYLRVKLTKAYLRAHIKRNLDKINISQYISIQTKFMLNANDFPTYSLGKIKYLNLKNQEDYRIYIKYLNELYEVIIKENKISKKITGIYLQYAAVTKKEYLDFIKNSKTR